MGLDDANDVELDLEVGDYLYQSDQELFLVVTAVNDTSHEFAVHGWREIADYRLDEYLNGDEGQLHRSTEVENAVSTRDDASTRLSLERLTDLFSVYENGLPSDGPHAEFRLADTDSKTGSNDDSKNDSNSDSDSDSDNE